MTTPSRPLGLILAGLALAVTGACSATSSSKAPASGPGTTTGSASAALPVGPIGHNGRWMTDAAGRVLLVHGVNMVEKTAPYEPGPAGFSATDATWLVDHGFRVVRLGILPTGLMPTPGVIDHAYLDSIAATVAVLDRAGLLTLLDYHQDGYGPSIGDDGFPAWMTLTGTAVNNHAKFPLYYAKDPAIQQAFQSFWDDAPGPNGVGLQEDMTAMYAAVAQRFASDPDVLGTDLLNEPWPGLTWQSCVSVAAGCPGLDMSELGAFSAKAVTAIRGAGDHHLILGEPFVLFNFGQSTTSVPDPGGDPNAGLSFHLYTLTTGAEPAVLTNAVAWSASTGGVIFNTEWGASQDPVAIDRQAGELDTALIPWLYWSFDGEMVPKLADPPTGTNVSTVAVAALTQAYPLAVAGTPTSFTFDPTARTLDFSWTPARPGGGSYPAGTVTSFEAPVSLYPTGYTVSGTGFTVTSTACAPLLTVTAPAGIAPVVLHVAPGGTCPSPGG